MLYKRKQETATDSRVGLQNQFQNLNAEVNRNVDKWTDRRPTSSIHKLELLCNPANKQNAP